MIRQYVDVSFIDGELMLGDTLRLYKGDNGILVSVRVEKQYYRNNKLVSENLIELGKYGRAIIRKAQSEESPVYCSDTALIREGRLDILIPAEAIDETNEMGTYQIQIQLYGDVASDLSRPRLTLDPFEFEACDLISEDMQLEEPEFNENEAIVDEGIVDHAILLNDGEELPVQDEEGNYNKTIWQKGHIIWANQLNKIENALSNLFTMIGSKISRVEMEEYVEEKISEIDIPDVDVSIDLSNYATIDHVHEEYVNDDEFNRTLIDYATINYVDRSMANIVIPDEALSDYVNEEEFNRTLIDYATINYVDRAISNIEIPDVDVGIDLSDYAKIEWVRENYLTTENFYENLSYELVDYVTYENLAERGYVTNDAINDRGYASYEWIHEQDYATEEYVNEQLGDIESILRSINGEEI